MTKKSFFGFLRNFLGVRKKKPAGNNVHASQQWDIIKPRLEELMDRQKPFLKPGYCIRDLANEMEVPSYQLSAFLNQGMGMHFNDYINNSRIRYCEQLMKDQLANKPHVKNLAQLCGFNNRNSFTTAFKKFTGRTPSDYVRCL